MKIADSGPWMLLKGKSNKSLEQPAWRRLRAATTLVPENAGHRNWAAAQLYVRLSKIPGLPSVRIVRPDSTCPCWRSDLCESCKSVGLGKRLKRGNQDRSRGSVWPIGSGCHEIDSVCGLGNGATAH
jgi:hypothetical protein